MVEGQDEAPTASLLLPGAPSSSTPPTGLRLADSGQASPAPLLPHQHAEPAPPLPLSQLLWCLGSPGVCVVVVFVVTLSLFPSVTEHIQPMAPACDRQGRLWQRSFVPLQFLLFNLFDWVRRRRIALPLVILMACLPAACSLPLPHRFYCLATRLCGGSS